MVAWCLEKALLLFDMLSKLRAEELKARYIYDFRINSSDSLYYYTKDTIKFTLSPSVLLCS